MKFNGFIVSAILICLLASCNRTPEVAPAIPRDPYVEAKVEKVLRATNICDYVLADGYIYYAVNDPKYSREFLNYDVSSYNRFTDMTGGIIYRLPMSKLDYEPMVAWTVSEEYYLYGVTENNPG